MGNSKKKSFAFDVLTLAGGTTFAQILMILSAPVLTRLYGPDDFGIWALYISITSIISVIALYWLRFVWNKGIVPGGFYRDGAAIRDEAKLVITALEDSELVLVDAA